MKGRNERRNEQRNERKNEETKLRKNEERKRWARKKRTKDEQRVGRITQGIQVMKEQK